jgi:hypothetical protein
MALPRKVALFLLLDELCEEEQEEDLYLSFLLPIVVSAWPHRLDPPILHSCSILKGGANFFFDNCDESSLEKVTRLDGACFDLIYSKFEPYWRKSMSSKSSHARLNSRKRTGRAALGLGLYFLAHGMPYTGLSLFTGLVLSSTSRYVRWSVKVLLRCLDDVPEATLDCPPAAYLQRIGHLAGEIYGSVMRGLCIITDGSLHGLEKDDNAQTNYFYDEHHPDYNGMKGIYCKKGLYFFCVDGTIVWHCIDVPGSWADGLVFDRSSTFVHALPEGCWILGDSAFAARPGKLERSRKKNEYLPEDPQQAQFQLQLERFSKKNRISSEWGVLGLKNCWRIMRMPFPSDDKEMRRAIWGCCMKLNNLKSRVMSRGQMTSVFLNDKEYQN